MSTQLGSLAEESSVNEVVSAPVSCHSAQQGSAEGAVWLVPVCGMLDFLPYCKLTRKGLSLLGIQQRHDGVGAALAQVTETAVSRDQSRGGGDRRGPASSSHH